MKKHDLQPRVIRGLSVVEFEVPDPKQNQAHGTKKVRHQIWEGMSVEQTMKLLRRAYEAGYHAGAMNPYC